MRRVFIGTAISLATLASASAADLPIYTKAPIYDWTGFYLGGGGSYSWGRISDTGTFIPGFSGTKLPETTTRSIDHTIRGIDGEIQGGYRKQFGTAVFGIEAVARLTDQHGSGSCLETYPTGYPTTGGGVVFGTVPSTFSCYKGTRLNSTEALLLEAGVLLTPQLLLQLSGGPSMGQIGTCDALAFTYIDTNAVTSGSSCQRTNKAGYWAGGGVEYAILRNLHLKIEYYHMDFGNVGTTTTWTDTTGNCTPGGSATGCVHTFTNGRRVTDDSVMIGFNYSFGGASVVAAPMYTK